jgi:hypothetical protein
VCGQSEVTSSSPTGESSFATSISTRRATPTGERQTRCDSTKSKVGRWDDDTTNARCCTWQHAPHVRVERVHHRFLWHRWRKKARSVGYRESTLPFTRRRDPDLREIVARLEADVVPRGADFAEALRRTREERRGAVVLYERMG